VTCSKQKKSLKRPTQCTLHAGDTLNAAVLEELKRVVDQSARDACAFAHTQDNA